MVKRNTFNAIGQTIYTDTSAAEGSYSGGDIFKRIKVGTPEEC